MGLEEGAEDWAGKARGEETDKGAGGMAEATGGERAGGREGGTVGVRVGEREGEKAEEREVERGVAREAVKVGAREAGLEGD